MYELIGAYPFDDDEAIAGEDYDYDIAGEEIIGYGLEDDGAFAGFTDDEIDAIAGLEEDLDVLAGYDDGSEVARLLEATAGLAPTPRRRVPPGRRGMVPPQRRVAAQRVARTVNGLGRQLRRERARTAQAVTALRRTRAQGAARPNGAPPNGAGGTRVIPAAGGGQRQIVQRQPSVSGVEPIGINSEGVVPAGQTRQIIVRPQVPLFRPTKYHISEAVGQNFLINNITIGKHSQFGTSGALPGTTFSDENLRFAWRTCQSGQEITVTVTNITSADHTFLSTMWGDSVD
jgi:hypothetical protein